MHYVGDIAGGALRRALKIFANHNIETHIPPGLPMVRVEPVLLEQVIFNLLDNASKYSSQGSTVRISGWADRSSVYLQVSDEGQGIPDADLSQIFNSFYRVRKTDHLQRLH